LALVSRGCSFTGIALFVLTLLVVPEGVFALSLVLLAVAVEVVAMVLGNWNWQPDPEGGPWHWPAVTAFMLPVASLFLPLCWLALLVFIYSPRRDQLAHPHGPLD
jgi:hypothetical protein